MQGKKRRPRISIENPGPSSRRSAGRSSRSTATTSTQILDACEQAKSVKGQPSIIVANTVKGKGISFMENDYNWHAKVPTAAELDAAIKELDAVGGRG